MWISHFRILILWLYILLIFSFLASNIRPNLLHILFNKFINTGFPGSSDGKESACIVGDPGSIPGSGRSPGEKNDYLLHYSCLENPMNRGAWWATVHGVVKSQTRLSDCTFLSYQHKRK